MKIICPTQDAARQFSREKIVLMIRNTPAVAARMAKARNADNLHDKLFEGGMSVRIAWPVIGELSMFDIPDMLLTDYDRMLENIDGEGSPFDLALKRTQTFGSLGMAIFESSPGRPVLDPEWKAATPHEAPPCTGILSIYNGGTRGKFYWQCPHCHEPFEPLFSALRWSARVRRVFLNKGQGGLDRDRARYGEPEKILQRKQARRSDIRLIYSGTDKLKDEVTLALTRKEADPTAFHLSGRLEDRVFAEFCAEIRTPKGWERRKPGLPNEALDLVVYGKALVIVLKGERVDWSMAQSSLDIETMVRDDLAQGIALGVDYAALHGSGAAGQPTGIAGTAGIGSVVGGANGVAPAWSHIVNLETEVLVDNSAIGSLAYLTNAKVRGKLKQVVKAASTAEFVWDNEGLNGYRTEVSNQVSSILTKGTSTGVCSAIFFGNWTDLAIGFWSGVDILVDPITLGLSGGVRVIAHQDCDVQLRRPQSFAAMLDALT